MPGAPVPPARIPDVPDAWLDAIALTECVSADDVPGVAAILKNCSLTETIRALDTLTARELVQGCSLTEAFALLPALARELQEDPSPGGTALTLSRALAERWCSDCVEAHEFRRWAVWQSHG